jgi:hypothetical protein
MIGQKPTDKIAPLALAIILAALLAAAVAPARADPLTVRLRYGLEIPEGWTDGLTDSLRSRAECQRKMAVLALASGIKMRCLVQIQPAATS